MYKCQGEGQKGQKQSNKQQATNNKSKLQTQTAKQQQQQEAGGSELRSQIKIKNFIQRVQF